jgi:hypothetical protein
MLATGRVTLIDGRVRTAKAKRRTTDDTDIHG